MGKSNKIADLHGNHVAQARTILVALGADEESTIWQNLTGKQIKITSVKWIPDTDVTGAATNNFIIGLVNKELLGVGVVAVTDLKTYASGIDSVAHKSEDLTLSSTAANLIVEENEVLSLDKTENGTGFAMPPGLVQITYEHLAQG